MTPRTPTREPPRRTDAPAAQDARRSRWVLAAGAIALLVVTIVALWFVGGAEPADVVPAQPDEAEEPQQPDAAEPQEPDAAEEPQGPDVPEPEIIYGQELRANWDVTGVAAGDRLNVRTGPGVHNPVAATLPADAVELESTGRVARVDGVLWREIVVPGDGTGWVNAGYVTETAPALLDDGRRAANLHEVDVDERTITVSGGPTAAGAAVCPARPGRSSGDLPLLLHGVSGRYGGP